MLFLGYQLVAYLWVSKSMLTSKELCDNYVVVSIINLTIVIAARQDVARENKSHACTLSGIQNAVSLTLNSYVWCLYVVVQR